MTTPLERLVWRAIWASDKDDVPAIVERSLRRCPPAAFIVFRRHLPDLAAGLARIDDILVAGEGRTRIAIDEEGGPVRRMPAPFPSFPAAVGWADSAATTADLERSATELGRRLRSAGIAIDFAPVADLGLDAEHPALKGRCFSANPAEAARWVGAMTRGLRAGGVAACVKHFPGHGAVGTDSHVELDTLQRDLATVRQADWVPFRAGIAAGAELMMAAHLLWPALTGEQLSTASPQLVRMAREELAFDGLLLTDDLEMGAIVGKSPPEEVAVAAIGAGYDGVLACHGFTRAESIAEALVRAAERSAALRARFAEIAARVDRLPQAPRPQQTSDALAKLAAPTAWPA